MSELKDWVDRRQCYPGTEDFLKGQDLLDFAKEERGDVVLLSFSRGIDSLAAWLYLRENDFFVVPFVMYHVPGLQYQERVLKYYEDYFGTHIFRLPHPVFYDTISHGCWQPPDQVATTAALDLPNIGYGTIDNLVARAHGMTDPFCTMGIRWAENLLRQTFIDQTGIMGFKDRRFFYPIWDWRIADVAGIILKYDLKISVEYEMFACTSDALNYRRLVQVRDRYPEDYQTILQWYPLLEAEIFRYESISGPQ